MSFRPPRVLCVLKMTRRLTRASMNQLRHWLDSVIEQIARSTRLTFSTGIEHLGGVRDIIIRSIKCGYGWIWVMRSKWKTRNLTWDRFEVPHNGSRLPRSWIYLNCTVIIICSLYLLFPMSFGTFTPPRITQAPARTLWRAERPTIARSLGSPFWPSGYILVSYIDALHAVIHQSTSRNSPN